MSAPALGGVGQEVEMNRFRATLLAATLALVLVVILASGAAAAPTAPLVDILDDFNGECDG